MLVQRPRVKVASPSNHLLRVRTWQCHRRLWTQATYTDMQSRVQCSHVVVQGEPGTQSMGTMMRNNAIMRTGRAHTYTICIK